MTKKKQQQTNKKIPSFCHQHSKHSGSDWMYHEKVTELQ